MRLRNDVRAIERAGFDHRGFDDFDAEGREACGNPAGLFCGTRHHETLTRKRQVLFPSESFPEFHDAAHNRDRGCRHVFAGNRLPRSLERRHHSALVRGRALLDKGERSFRVLAAFHKPAGNEIHVGDAHQEDERAGALGERLEIERKGIARFCLFVARNDMEARRNPAMAYGDTRIRRHGDGGSNSRDHLEFDTGSNKFQSLLATSPEYERVATLEARNRCTGHFTCKLHQKLVDFGLFDLVVRRHLAHVHHLGFRIAEPKNCRRNQAVVHHHVGLFQNFLTTERQ